MKQAAVEQDALDADGETFYKFAGYRYQLFVIKNKPELLTEHFLDEFAKRQLDAEQGTWKSWYTDGRGHSITPRVPPQAWEWQTAIEQQPDFAKGPLLDAFIFPQQPWSFAKSVDRQTPAEVFLFSRSKIEGRDESFVARELHPIVKQQLLMASQKSPRLLWLRVNLPQWDWDGSSVRFLTGNPGTPYLESVSVLPPVLSSSLYVRKGKHPSEFPSLYAFNEGTGKMDVRPVPATLPGRESVNSPTGWWRNESFLSTVSQDHFPLLQVIALDHKAEFPDLKISSAAAEELHKNFAHLSARLLLELEGMDIADTKAEDHGFDSLTLFAKVKRVDILSDKDDATVISLAGSSLPVGSAVPAEITTAPPRQVPAGKTGSFSESLRKTQEQNRQNSENARAARQADTKAKVHEARIRNCENSAARQSPSESAAEIHEACVQQIEQREGKQQ